VSLLLVPLAVATACRSFIALRQSPELHWRRERLLMGLSSTIVFSFLVAHGLVAMGIPPSHWIMPSWRRNRVDRESWHVQLATQVQNLEACRTRSDTLALRLMWTNEPKRQVHSLGQFLEASVVKCMGQQMKRMSLPRLNDYDEVRCDFIVQGTIYRGPFREDGRPGCFWTKR